MQLVVAPGEQKPPPSPGFVPARSPPPGALALQLIAQLITMTRAPKIAVRETTVYDIRRLLD